MIGESTEVPPRGHQLRIMAESGHFGVENYAFNISLKIILFKIDGKCFLNNFEMTGLIKGSVSSDFSHKKLFK